MRPDRFSFFEEPPEPPVPFRRWIQRAVITAVMVGIAAALQLLHSSGRI
jgi:hypothetical protein